MNSSSSVPTKLGGVLVGLTLLFSSNQHVRGVETTFIDASSRLVSVDPMTGEGIAQSLREPWALENLHRPLSLSELAAHARAEIPRIFVRRIAGVRDAAACEVTEDIGLSRAQEPGRIAVRAD